MRISQLDFTILIAALLIILFSTIMLPSMGMVESDSMPDLDEDMPDLDIDAAMVDRAGERPERPTTPDGGELVYDEGASVVDGHENHREWVRRDAGETPAQVYIRLSPFFDSGEFDYWNFSIHAFDSDGNPVSDEGVELHEADDDGRVSVEEFDIYGQIVEQEADDDQEAVLEWEIVEGPQDSAWFSGIPVIGGLFAAGAQVAGTIQWAITVVFWFIAWLVNLALMGIHVFVLGILFGLELLALAATSQAILISEAPGIASIILVVVNAVFGIMLMKMAFIFIKALPTT